MFLSLYQEQKVLTCQSTESLKKVQLRTCRFCGKNYGEVKFKSKAHIFPEGLGNKYSISDFECDECNSRFGVYENDLMNYLGVLRTLSKTKGKKSIPQFKSSNLKASAQEIFDYPDAIKLESFSEKNFQFDLENCEQVINVKKPPYIPLNVFKVFLKIALCALPENEI